MQNISPRVKKISVNSNIYIIDDKIAIDTGDRAYHDELTKLDLSNISHVFFTHLHLDHVGNIDLFKNARYFASIDAINTFKNNPFGTVLDNRCIELLKQIRLEPATDMLGLKVISTPGHTKGSVCYYFEEEDILFTGDTKFSEDLFGRLDLPTSVQEQMQDSLKKISKYKRICPGHDYD